MRELDGEDAGGQFVRSALALAALEGEAVRIENVRGDRSTPGLRPQHLAVLEALAAIRDAECSGAEVGAETIEFDPGAGAGSIPGGEYEVAIGTAGSVTLLFDAVLPLATALQEPLTIAATGGTDVAWSPPLAYFEQVKLPLLRRVGLVAACEVDRRGFYPEGGGRATLHLAPSRLEPLAFGERGPVTGVRCYSVEATALAEADVADRQLEGALSALSTDYPLRGRSGVDRRDEPASGSDADLDASDADRGAADADRGAADRNPDRDAADPGSELEVRERRTTTAASPSPGSAIVLRLEHEGGLAGASALGEPGKRAERVGEEAADDAKRFLESGAAVDRYLADQLLVPLALAGGRVRIPAMTDHVEASLALLSAFGFDVERERRAASVLLSARRDRRLADR